MSDAKDEEEGADDEPVEGGSGDDLPEEDAPGAPVRLAWEAAVAKPVDDEPEADTLEGDESESDEAGEGAAHEIELDDDEAAGDEYEEEDEDVEAGVVTAVEPGLVEDEQVEEEPAEDELVEAESEEAARVVAEEAIAGAAGEPVEPLLVEDEIDEAPEVEEGDSQGEAIVDELEDVAPVEDAPVEQAVAFGAAAGQRVQPAIQYAKRNARFDKQDCGWWVDGDYLYETDGRGREWRTHLGDVLEVQTAPAPAKFRPWRHQTVLGLRNSRRIAIDNAHYVGTANYEDRSRSYAPFVRKLIEVVAEKAPYAKARRGASYLGYVAMLAFVVLLIGLAATLLFLLPIEGVPGILLIKIALVALMAPPLFMWVAKSRPSGLPLAELPPGALPRARR